MTVYSVFIVWVFLRDALKAAGHTLSEDSSSVIYSHGLQDQDSDSNLSSDSEGEGMDDARCISPGEKSNDEAQDSHYEPGTNEEEDWNAECCIGEVGGNWQIDPNGIETMRTSDDGGEATNVHFAGARSRAVFSADSCAQQSQEKNTCHVKQRASRRSTNRAVRRWSS